ncbi:KN motif and ankyrin repeat domain-containing protein 3 [Conger conger]|uniref:KN motif and ankyrin repeat domain-containing protein 3 n=1 Tax=Conger conger TaxID=82655 RepID=UPI002A5AFBF2|nr:KN motif and ankyrin repeat domain-containing protein 3 [Conger conger]
MTIGKSSKKSLKSPKYLDLSSGFYGRLEEAEADQETEELGRAEGRTAGGEMQTHAATQRGGKRGSGVFDFNQGMLEDDGTATLLRKTPARRSSRWRRKSGSRKKRLEAEPEDCAPAEESASPARAGETLEVVDSAAPQTMEVVDSAAPQTMEVVDSAAPQTLEAGHLLVHFSVREEADDHVLISKTAERETEGLRGDEEVKVAKRGKLKNYRKALDRALRRGWETFVCSLYSVTLTPISSTETSPSSSSATTARQSSAIAEYR